MALEHPDIPIEDLKLDWRAPEGILYYEVWIRKSNKGHIGPCVYPIHPIKVPDNQQMLVDIRKLLASSKDEVTVGLYFFFFMAHNCGSYAEKDIPFDLCTEQAAEINQIINDRKKVEAEQAAIQLQQQKQKEEEEMAKAKKSATKKAKPKLPTPGLKIGREDGKVVLNIHLPSDTCKGVIIEVRNFITGSTLCPADKNRHEVKQASRELTVYLENLKIDDGMKMTMGKYSVSVIAFNGETETESDPIIEMFDIREGDVGLVEATNPAEALPPSKPKDKRPAPKELVSLQEPLDEALKGKKVDKKSMKKETAPLPAQSTVPPTPDVRFRGLQMSVKIDPTSTEFVEVVGKTEDGRVVIPLHQYPVEGRIEDDFFLRGHLKTLLQGQTLEVEPDEEISLEITAIGHDGGRSATTTISGQLTQEEIKRINMPEPKKPETDKVIPAIVKTEERQQERLEAPKAEANPPATLPPANKKSPATTSAPAPAAKPDRMDEALKRIAMLASQESVNKLGEAVASSTEILANKADKVNAGMVDVNKKVETGFKATENGLEAVKDRVTDGVEAVKTEVREGLAKIAKTPAGQSTTKESKPGRWIKGVMLAIVIVFVAIILGTAVIYFVNAAFSHLAERKISVIRDSSVEDSTESNRQNASTNHTAELIAQQEDIERLQRQLLARQWTKVQPALVTATTYSPKEEVAKVVPAKHHVHTKVVTEEVVEEHRPVVVSAPRRSFLGGLIQVHIGVGGRGHYGAYRYHNRGRYHPTTGYVAETGGYSVDPWALNHTWAQRVGEVKVHQGYSYVVPNLRVERHGH